MLFKLAKRKKLNTLLNMAILSLPVVLTVGSLAWFKDTSKVDIGMNSTIHGQYFQSGDGSSEHPFEIARKNQLYYLSWLQQMGFFNHEEGGKMKQYYFSLSADLDMTGYTLPPIGTQEYPFIGNFNGNGHTISNLTVYNTNFTDTPVDVVNGVEIVGFFGVVGTLDAPSNPSGAYEESDYKVYAQTDSGLSSVKYTYDNSVVSVRNFRLKNCNVQTQTQNTLIGIAAGYVNGDMNAVTIVDSNISVKEGAQALSYTSNISDYSVVGYCRDQYISEKVLDPIEREGIEVPAGTEDVLIEDAGNAWGGSLDMHTMFNNLGAIRNKTTTFSATNTPSFISSEDEIIDEVNGTKRIENQQTTTLYNARKTTESRFYDQTDLGKFYFYNTNDTFLYLYGQNNDEQKKTITTYTYKNEYNNCFFISSGSNYLSANGSNNGLINVTNEENATKWQFDSSNRIFKQVYDTKYYLNCTLDTLSLSTTNNTSWTKTANSIYANKGNSTVPINCYITYNNGWKVDQSEYFYISDGNSNYLSLSSTTAITNVTNQNNATKWFFANPTNKTGQVAGIYNGNITYLRINNNALQANTTVGNAANWSNNGEYLYNGTNRLAYSPASGWKLITNINTPYLVSSGSNYLTASFGTNWLGNVSPSLTNSTNANNATKWVFSDTSNSTYPAGTMTTSYNGTTYYVNISRNSLSLGTTSYTLTNNDGKLARSNYYMRYNNGWTGTNNSGNATVLTFTPVVDSTDIYGVAQKITNDFPLTLGNTQEQIVTKTTRTETGGFPTYFPLSMEKDSSNNFSTARGNTGYVISGGFSSASQSGRGDIRVSQYALSRVSGSYTSGDDFDMENESTYKVRTINGSGDHQITTSEIENFGKYEDSKEDFIPVLKGQSNVYGLHFMKTAISMDNIVEAEQATVNNVTYHDEENGRKYQLPMDCIDFNLGSKGYINFFAGTYYSGNKSFFSLHRIFRDDSGFTITDIKEIDKVFKPENVSDEYIYKYTDGTYSEPGFVENETKNPTAFDTKWIKTRSSLTTDSIYYFEVPVNAGEFALGSDPSSDGAYLLYLDLSANKQTAKRTITGTTSIISTDTVRTPTGVQIVKDGDDGEFDPFNSATYQLGAGYSNATVDGNGVITGSINFNRTYDSTLGKDRIDVIKGSDADESVLPTFVGYYQDGEDLKTIFSNPPGFDEHGNIIPYIPYRREYVSNYSLDYVDTNAQTGTTSRTVISCVDTTISYADGTKDISRIIRFDVYLTPKGATEETLILSMYSDSVSDNDRVNFTYSFSPFNNSYYFTIQYNDNVNSASTLGMHIIAMNPEGTNYKFMIANTGDLLITGSPTEENPINISIAETETNFDSLFRPASEYEPVD
ncbi:MAG: hypothetical protein MJZ37_04415 [Bacilli bacterium]|nr:hypothetical protein [Bacilli bacterium]